MCRQQLEIEGTMKTMSEELSVKSACHAIVVKVNSASVLDYLKMEVTFSKIEIFTP